MNEICMHSFNSLTKFATNALKYIYLLSTSRKKIWQTKSADMNMMIIFSDHTCVIYHYDVPPNITIKHEYYVFVFKFLRQQILRKICELLSITSR